MLANYTNTPTLKQQFRSVFALKKELEISTKEDIKEWIQARMKNEVIPVHIVKYGLYSASNTEPNDINALLTSIHKIREKNTTRMNSDAHMDINIPSPPPFEFHTNYRDENTSNSSASKSKYNLFSLSSSLISFICTFHDLNSLLMFEKCSKRAHAIAHEPDSYHNKYFTFKYSFALHDSIDVLGESLPRFSKTKSVSIDHFGKYDGNDYNVWKCVIDEIFTRFVCFETLIFGSDWIAVQYLTQIIKQKRDESSWLLHNITIKHSLQQKKLVTKKKTYKSHSKSRCRTRSKTKQLHKERCDGGNYEEKVCYERTKKEEITEITMTQSLAISTMISAFKYLNNITFDMVQIPPMDDIFNCLRNVPVECIAFNDCMELGFFDNDTFIMPPISNRKPLLCQSMIIRDIDSNTFDEFFDPQCCRYFWPMNGLKNLMIHWNITKRDYDSFINTNIKQQNHIMMKSKRQKKVTPSLRLISSFFPNLSSVDTLYISIINGNGLKSLILFLSQTKLLQNVKRFVLRMPKAAAKAQITLNNDLGRLLEQLSVNKLEYLRLEIVSFSWISIWNTLNVLAQHCCVSLQDENDERDHEYLAALQTLDVYLYSPFHKTRVKNSDDLIIKIQHSISRINVNSLALFIEGSRDINVDICKSFEKDGFEKDAHLLWFRRKAKNVDQNITACTSHMEQYWEPVGIDPYA